MLSRSILTVCLCLIAGARFYAQPDTSYRTVTGPADFFKRSEPRKPDTTTTMPSLSVAMPRIDYYRLQPGNKEGMPAGLYAQFLPPLPDTVKVYEGGSEEYFTIGTQANKEVIYGDSIAIFFEVERRKAIYAGKPAPQKKGKTTGMITRSGFIPSQGFGTNRYRFAVTPSKFRISPGAIIQASVHILGAEKNMGTILCSVTSVDFEHSTFYVETSNEVPAGEHINWVIMNFPEE